MNNAFIKKTDVLILGLIFAFAAVLMLFMYNGKTASIAKIYKDNKLIQTVNLAEDTDFIYDNFNFSVRGGSIAVTNSPCKNKICVHTGYISKGGQAIVCLPERMVVTLVSEDGFDAVVG